MRETVRVEPWECMGGGGRGEVANAWGVTSLLSPPLRGDVPPDQGSISVIHISRGRTTSSHRRTRAPQPCRIRLFIHPTSTCSPRSGRCSILICNTGILPPDLPPSFFQTVVRIRITNLCGSAALRNSRTNIPFTKPLLFLHPNIAAIHLQASLQVIIANAGKLCSHTITYKAVQTP
jgi:hypothetical protein